MRAPRIGFVWSVVLAMALAAGCATTRSSQPPTRVVVVLEGAKARSMTEQLTAMLGDRYEIVPDADYRKAARKLKARKVSRENVARIAEAIRADAVIVGQVDRRKRGRYKLYLQLREGATGKLDTIYKLRMRGAKLGDAQKQELDGLLVRIAAVQRVEPAEDEAVAAKEPAKKQEKAAKKEEPKKEPEKAAKKEEPKKGEPKKGDKVARGDKGKKKPAAEEDEEDEEDDDEDPVLEIKTDEKGQVIDDETPPGL